MPATFGGVTHYLFGPAVVETSLGARAVNVTATQVLASAGGAALTVRDLTGAVVVPFTNAEGTLSAFYAPQLDPVLVDLGATMHPLASIEVGTLVAQLAPLDPDLTTIAALDSSVPGVLATDGAGWVRKAPALYLSVKDFGAVGDGVADDTAAVQAALNAALAAGGGHVMLSGTHKVSATLGLNAGTDVLLRGRGANIDSLVPTAALAGLPVVRFVNSRRCGAQDLNIGGLAASPPSHGLLFRQESGGTIPSTKGIARRVLFGGTGAGDGLLCGVGWTVGVDVNNDFGYVEDCEWQNLLDCIHIEGANSLLHHIKGGVANPNISGRFIKFVGGSAHVEGTRLVGLDSWLFDLEAGTYFRAITAQGIKTEGCPLWVRSVAGVSSPNGLSFTLVGCHLSGGTSGVDPIQWAAGNCDFSVLGGTVASGQTLTKGVFSDSSCRAGFTNVQIGLTGFDIAGILCVLGGAYLSGAPVITNLGGTASIIETGVTSSSLGPQSLQFGRVGAAGLGIKPAAANILGVYYGSELLARIAQGGAVGVSTLKPLGLGGPARIDLTDVNNTVVGGGLKHSGTTVGLNGATPVAKAAAIVNADGTLTDITSKFNTLLAYLRARGDITA